MSFVPAPQQANAAGAKNAPSAVTSSSAAPAAEQEADKDLLFKLRTFDVYWVEKSALMYRDGIDKVSEIVNWMFEMLHFGREIGIFIVHVWRLV